LKNRQAQSHRSSRTVSSSILIPRNGVLAEKQGTLIVVGKALDE
jgi:hypothetical protein